MRLIATIFLIIFMPMCVSAKDLGRIGNTYPIAEKDALEEIKERAKNVDIKQYVNKNKLETKIKNFLPSDAPQLKTANIDSSFTVDLTYTLDFDIPDGRGNILYPKGYKFNPLDYINYNKTIVVINGADNRQVEWFEKSVHGKDINTLLLITNGSYYSLSQRLKRQVFYANPKIVEIFELKYVPSVIYQKGNVMEVKEIAVNVKNN